MNALKNEEDRKDQPPASQKIKIFGKEGQNRKICTATNKKVDLETDNAPKPITCDTVNTDKNADLTIKTHNEQQPAVIKEEKGLERECKDPTITRQENIKHETHDMEAPSTLKKTT